MAPAPFIVIVGRPNVGKSTLFNLLAMKPLAITSPLAGTTRDWNVADIELAGYAVKLVDTGGWGGKDGLGQLVGESVAEVLNRSEMVLFLVNPGVALGEADIELARTIRARGIPAIIVCNKCDREDEDALAWQFMRLGLGSPVPFSATQKRNLNELLSRIGGTLASLNTHAGYAGESIERVRCIFTGQPNVGKSSLFNALLADARSLVHSEPGTTRDPVRATAELGGRDWEIIDTAGVWSRLGRTESIHRDAQKRGLRAVREGTIAILVLDLTKPFARHDLKLAAVGPRKGVGLVVALNKCDLVPESKASGFLKEASGYLYSRFTDLGRFPIILASAVSGEGIESIKAAISEMARLRESEFTPEALSDVSYSWPTSGRAWKVRQTGTAPPTFSVRVPRGVKPNTRFVVNRLRNGLGLHGVPLVINWSAKVGGDDN